MLRNQEGLVDISARLAGLGPKLVLMLNNDVTPRVLRHLLRQGASRAVVRSRDSASSYQFTKDAYVVHVARHSLPHLQSFATGGGLEADRDPNRVIWLGATREEKGFHHLLRAWPLVRAAAPDARLDVFGSIRLHLPTAEVGASGVLTPAFEADYLDPIVGPGGDPTRVGIHFRGARPKSEVAEAARRASVGVVNPNLRGATETFCISAVELQAAGCPCVGAAAGGLTETIKDGESGLLVTSQSPDQLAAAIVRVLKEPDLRSRLSDGARAHSAGFADIGQEAAAWRDVFEHTLSGERGAATDMSLAARILRAFDSITLARVFSRARRWVLESRQG